MASVGFAEAPGAGVLSSSLAHGAWPQKAVHWAGGRERGECSRNRVRSCGFWGAVEEGGLWMPEAVLTWHSMNTAEILGVYLRGLALHVGRVGVTHSFQRHKWAEIPVTGHHKILKGCRLNFNPNCLTSTVSTAPHDK